MRLTSIINALFESGGDDIYIGDTRLEGIIIDKSDDTIVGSTIASNLDSSGLRISTSKTSSVVGDSTRLVATANIEFESYSWEISGGTASFVNGVDTGSVVYVTDSELSNNVVTLIAVLSGAERRVQLPINFTTGFFNNARIIGPTVIDSSDPVKYILSSSVSPDTALWGVTGGGELSDGSTQMEKYITADESGDDINLQITLSRAGYNSEVIDFSVAVSKCELSGGAAIVERPTIISPIDEEMDDQYSVTMSNFHGINSESTIQYQIELFGGNFSSPLLDEEVSYANMFSVNGGTLVGGADYILRVRFKDDLGNSSLWSDIINFSILSEDEHLPGGALTEVDFFHDNSGVALATFNDSLEELSGNFPITTHGNSTFIDGPFGKGYTSLASDDYFYFNGLGNFFDNRGEATISFWAKPSRNIRASGYTMMLSYKTHTAPHYMMGVSLSPSGFYVFNSIGASIVDSVARDIDTFYHIVITFKKGILSVYLDNVFIGADTMETKLRDCYAHLSFGRIPTLMTDINNSASVSIAQVRVFSRHVSPEEVGYLNSETSVATGKYRLTNYWATNTQNPIDWVGSKNASSYFCEIDHSGYFDNITRFNNPTAYIGVPGPQDIDFTSWSSPFTLSVGFILEDLHNGTVFTIGTGDYQSMGIGIGLNGNVNLVASTNGTTWTILQYSATNSISSGRNIVILTRDTNGKYTLFLNDVALISQTIASNLVLNNDTIKFGAHYSFNALHYFKSGGIEEVALWDYELSSQEIADWRSRLIRPFGGEKKLAMPCTAVDQPAILSDKGRRIYATEYFGEREFNRIEYQVFDRFELEYITPVLHGLLSTPEVALIANTIASKDYKVRIRYYDVDNNKSMWSRPKIFDIYFIPPSTHDFLLTDNKDNSGFTNVTQHGLPDVSNGFCQFGFNDYFAFDRFTFSYGSISLWVKFDNLDTAGGGYNTMIFGSQTPSNKSYLWYRTTSNTFKLSDSAEGDILISNTKVVATDVWYNIIITMDEYESRIFVDMMDLGTGSSIPTELDYVGTGYNDGVDYGFMGGIKGFRVYPEILTHDERLDIFQEYD